MKPVKLKENIYWVGGIDWDLRNFHGYLTQRGSTYNAYLIVDEKITLIDTVKYYLYDEMMERISAVVDPSRISYIVSNHVEMDHSGSLPMLKDVAKNAVVLTSPNGEKGLKLHYKKDLNLQVVKTGDTVKTGSRSLSFLLTQMVHWPDNMVCYMPEEKILFSNDAFGQHIASSERFDDEYPLEIVLEEARKYYANIVLPYSPQVKKALEAASSLDIGMIAPSHGVIWRSHIGDILEAYGGWADNRTEEKAVIVYDTMWNSTRKMAYAVAKAFENRGMAVRMLDLKANHISDIMTEVLTAKYICVGFPDAEQQHAAQRGRVPHLPQGARAERQDRPRLRLLRVGRAERRPGRGVPGRGRVRHDGKDTGAVCARRERPRGNHEEGGSGHRVSAGRGIAARRIPDGKYFA